MTGSDDGDATLPVRDRLSVRVARPDDRLAVTRVLDGAMLAVEDVPERIAAGDVLVAVDDGTVCGALVLAPDGPPESGVGASDTDPRASTADPESPADSPGCPARWRSYPYVHAIAVRRRRRDRGIGTALVRSAAERAGALVADFEDGLQPFYESLGAELVPGSEHRWWALIPADC